MLKNKFLYVLFITVYFFGIFTSAYTQVISRKLIASAAGTLTAGNYQISFSIGETNTSTLSAGNSMITQGFQQPGESIQTGNVDSSWCAGNNLQVPYSAMDIGGGNNFFAQLSDASGSFANPVNIGSQAGNASGVINANVPPDIVAGSGYKIRVVSTYPPLISNPTSGNITINTTGSCGVTINLKLYLQGYYLAHGNMQPVLYNQGVSAQGFDADSILVEIRNSTTYQLLRSASTMLHTDGTASVDFPYLSGNYYIVVKHRNSIETWSAVTPVITRSVNYDFSIAASQAYGNKQTEVEPGVWAFYTGDLNQDGNIDVADFLTLAPDIDNATGYQVTDINGDGNVDISDFLIFAPNIDIISTIHPL